MILGDTIMYFPQGTHRTQIARKNAVPAAVAGGAWPSLSTQGGAVGDDPSAPWFAYPGDVMAAISYFTNAGVTTLVSPNPTLPAGYNGGAVVHEPHVMHPNGTGFAVLRADTLAPISTTISGYLRWDHFPMDVS